MSDLFWECLFEVLLFPAAGSKRLWLPLRLFCILLLLVMFGGISLLLCIVGISMLSMEPVKGIACFLLGSGILLWMLQKLRRRYLHHT